MKAVFLGSAAIALVGVYWFISQGETEMPIEDTEFEQAYVSPDNPMTGNNEQQAASIQSPSETASSQIADNEALKAVMDDAQKLANNQTSQEEDYEDYIDPLQKFDIEQKSFIQGDAIKVRSVVELLREDTNSVMDSLANKSYNDHNIMDKRNNFENYFNTIEQNTDMPVGLNRVECGESLCVAAFNAEDDKSWSSYYETIKSSGQESMFALTNLQDSNKPNQRLLMFSTNSDIKGLNPLP
ncbi:MAG: hypothetical protein AAGB12_06005 [Pseudomonadota bacterium]